ncbi:OPA3 family protein [Colletotrichum orchidophilum]|uniref:OPA3 family protein n=1 Tax=Colletotrichum orchidophilum TaxID=1209926 RepID=A0A1G4B8S8_9PEZI|nr:OPA3 family protein [Colletotrichum orchidophilum]OHE97811.1 OPA3 family protein [Colletotrichum orchidophilum]
MVPLPLFKLAALFVRHISKYGANQIKAQAHDHPKFRAFAARYGQHIHQLNMRLSVALLRNPDAEQRAKEKAEAATVKTKEQVEKEEAKAQKAKLAAENPDLTKPIPLTSTSASASASSSSLSSSSSSSSTTTSTSSTKERPRFKSVWRRKFRSLPEAKAVDLFADVIGDTFILGVASAIILYEYWKSSQKPDQNAEHIKALDARLEELTRREEELSQKEAERTERYQALEAALKELRDPKTKKPLLPSLQLLPAPTQTLNTHDIALPVSQDRTYRLVLLSPKDVGTQATEQRLERLYNLNGGRDVAIMFLLHPVAGQAKDPMEAFMDLQIEILDKLDLPLLPLTSITALPSTLTTLQTSLGPTQPGTISSGDQATPVSLLQHMASGNGPLPEHSANLLSELGRSPREVAALADTEQGRARILDLLGPMDGARVLSFLAREKLALT